METPEHLLSAVIDGLTALSEHGDVPNDARTLFDGMRQLAADISPWIGEAHEDAISQTA